jgi:hypothetical protein
MRSMYCRVKYVYIKSTKVYVPWSELGLSQPLSRQGVCLSPRTGEGAHSPGGEGMGESQFRRLETKLSNLPTLWFSGTPTYKNCVEKCTHCCVHRIGPQFCETQGHGEDTVKKTEKTDIKNGKRLFFSNKMSKYFECILMQYRDCSFSCIL